MAIWSLTALCATYWWMKFAGSNAATVSVATVAEPAPDVEPADLTRIFGPPIAAAPVSLATAPLPIDPSTRFLLVGVVADRARTGVALISVEGKAARPYRVGSRVDDSYTLKSVATRSATLVPASPDGAAFTLELTPVASAPPVASAAPVAIPRQLSAPPPMPFPPPDWTPPPPRTPRPRQPPAPVG